MYRLFARPVMFRTQPHLKPVMLRYLPIGRTMHDVMALQVTGRKSFEIIVFNHFFSAQEAFFNVLHYTFHHFSFLLPARPGGLTMPDNKTVIYS